jgi:hypothetical protein
LFAVHKRKVFAEKGHCFITFENKESVVQAVEFMKDAETRKRLVEEAKEAQQEHKMNPLCAPHPQFYVRVPNQKNKKKQKQQKREEPSTPDIPEAPFTEVKAKSQPQRTAPGVPSSLPVAPSPSTPARPRPTSLPQEAGSAENEPPQPVPIHKPPRFLKKKLPRILKAEPEIDLNDMDTFPTSSNVFTMLDDEE